MRQNRVGPISTPAEGIWQAHSFNRNMNLIRTQSQSLERSMAGQRGRLNGVGGMSELGGVGVIIPHHGPGYHSPSTQPGSLDTATSITTPLLLTDQQVRDWESWRRGFQGMGGVGRCEEEAIMYNTYGSNHVSNIAGNSMGQGGMGQLDLSFLSDLDLTSIPGASYVKGKIEEWLPGSDWRIVAGLGVLGLVAVLAIKVPGSMKE